MDRKTRARITQASDQFASNMALLPFIGCLVLGAQASPPACSQDGLRLDVGKGTLFVSNTGLGWTRAGGDACGPRTENHVYENSDD